MSSDLLELIHDERLDQTEVLRLTIPATSQRARLIAPDYELTWRERRFKISETEGDRAGPRTTLSVIAEATWYELGDLAHVGSLVIVDHTPHDGLAVILDTAGDWTTDDTTSSTSTDVFSMEAQDKSVLELIRRWAKITGRYIIWDTLTRKVAIVDSRGVDLGLGFRYRRNLRRMRRRIKPPPVTVLYPFGADGLTIAGINGGLPYLEDFSYYTDQGLTLAEARARFTRRKVWSDRSFIVDTDLLAAASVRLAELAQPIVSYELDVVDLTEIEHVAELLHVGDTVRVSDPDLGDDVRTTVVRYERHPNKPVRNRVELAYLPKSLDDPDSSSGRPSTAEDWRLFVGPVRAMYQVRNDGDYIVARIPLRFREGGKAHYHLDLWAEGVGAGDLIVTVIDAENGDAQQFKQVRVPYTDGATVRATLQWAATGLEGSRDYRVRVTTEASGGADPGNGVDIAADVEDPAEASFWIKALAAVQETPTAENSVRYDFTGAVQTFTVPDNVTEIVVEAHGAKGADGGSPPDGGSGGMVTATFTVIPGTVYDVYVGGIGEGPNASPEGGWPNGGRGGDTGSDSGAGGGGSTDLRPTGSGMASAIIVAAGGGGGADNSVSNPFPPGGAGGFYNGEQGRNDNSSIFTGGATQFAGGTGSGGNDGTFGQGGDGVDTGDPFAFGGGGGGGGWYGGEGGESLRPGLSGLSPGGGGGSGWVAAGASNLLIADGENAGEGYLIVSWETPL